MVEDSLLAATKYPGGGGGGGDGRRASWKGERLDWTTHAAGQRRGRPNHLRPAAHEPSAWRDIGEATAKRRVERRTGPGAERERMRCGRRKWWCWPAPAPAAAGLLALSLRTRPTGTDTAAPPLACRRLLGPFLPQTLAPPGPALSLNLSISLVPEF